MVELAVIHVERVADEQVELQPRLREHEDQQVVFHEPVPLLQHQDLSEPVELWVLRPLHPQEPLHELQRGPPLPRHVRVGAGEVVHDRVQSPEDRLLQRHNHPLEAQLPPTVRLPVAVAPARAPPARQRVWVRVAGQPLGLRPLGVEELEAVHGELDLDPALNEVAHEQEPQLKQRHRHLQLAEVRGHLDPLEDEFTVRAVLKESRERPTEAVSGVRFKKRTAAEEQRQSTEAVRDERCRR